MPIAYKKLEKNYELELIGDITLSEEQREDILLKLSDFLGSSAKTLVLDFEKVTFVNSNAFGFLFIIKEKVDEVGKELIISKPKDVVKHLLESYNFSKIFNIIWE